MTLYKSIYLLTYILKNKQMTLNILLTPTNGVGMGNDSLLNDF